MHSNYPYFIANSCLYALSLTFFIYLQKTAVMLDQAGGILYTTNTKIEVHVLQDAIQFVSTPHKLKREEENMLQQNSERAQVFLNKHLSRYELVRL